MCATTQMIERALGVLQSQNKSVSSMFLRQETQKYVKMLLLKLYRLVRFKRQQKKLTVYQPVVAHEPLRNSGPNLAVKS